MQVQLPSHARESKNEPLARCIEFAAARSGVNEFALTIALSYFLEQIADENTKGREVMIPGFGIFIPVADTKFRGPDRVLKCRVRFHPSAGYAQQVRHGAPPLERNTKRWTGYCQNHSLGDRVPRNGSRVFTAMQSLRMHISKQLAHAHDP